MASKCIIKDDHGDELVCYGYRRNYFKSVLYYFFMLCTGGFLWLVSYWRPEWELKMTFSRCSLMLAQKVLLKTAFGFWCVEIVQTRQLENYKNKTNYSCNGSTVVSPDDIHTLPSPSHASVTDDCLSSDGSEAELESLLRASSNPAGKIKFFVHRHLRYMWSEKDKNFSLLRALENKITPTQVYEHAVGLSSADVFQRQTMYGKNSIDVEVKSHFRLWLEEAADPFYVFQLFSCLLWFSDEYYYYAAAIMLISLVSITISVIQTRKHLVNLRDMVLMSGHIDVLRDGAVVGIPTEELVPGDVIIIPHNGTIMHCDAALISGNCIVNESMLTGESVPVTKTPLPHAATPKKAVNMEEEEELYSPIKHKRHTLFNGTKIIQTRYYGNARVLAVVIRTGFSTTKGSLIRSILNPKPMGFKFFRDSMRFIGVLVILAICGFIYSVVVFIKQGITVGAILKKSLDVITIAVPPALPAAMSVGIVYALQRLKKQSINCINPSRINVCGKVKLMCFDKTGTLTEDGLDVLGVVPVEKASFKSIVPFGSSLSRGPLLAAMATCHSLTVIDGELTGDPLDLKMFESTDWVLEEPGEDTTKFDSIVPTTVKPRTSEAFKLESALEGHTPYEIAIIKQFPFSSDIQRMSVITRTLGSQNMDVHLKGAPETVVSLCRPETVPDKFQEVLSDYTQHGYRVLGIAHKQLESKVSWHHVQRITRNVVECDLTFAGLLVMQNALKPETTPVIDRLQKAAIRTVMVTGDNMLTAVSVARECGMVKPKQKVLLVSVKQGDETPESELQLSWSVVGEVSQEAQDAAEVEILKAIDEDTLSETGCELSCCPRSLNKKLTVNWIGEYNLRALKRTEFDSYTIAASGKAYGAIREHDFSLLNRLMLSGTIFARMSPEQKTHLVEDMQRLGYCVGMCGDGANDCGALKAAHCGISLSEAEASVASPFTSKISNIECVPKVIREGRCALVTSFGCFKYMALYSIVQFVSVLMLYSIGSNLGDIQFLYIDLGIITAFALVMGRADSYKGLVARRPQGSLVAPLVLFSLFSHILLTIATQVSMFYYVQTEPWFVPVNLSKITGDDEVLITCHQNSVLFCLSSFQYILLAVAFAKGAPYRKPIFKNYWFIIMLLIFVVWTGFLTVYPGQVQAKFFELDILPDMMFRITILGVAGLHFVLAIIIEDFIVPSACLRKLLNRIRCKTKPKNYYKVVHADMEKDPEWPPLPG